MWDQMICWSQLICSGADHAPHYNTSAVNNSKHHISASRMHRAVNATFDIHTLLCAASVNVWLTGF